MKNPIIYLVVAPNNHPLQVEVGEDTDSKCNGTVTITIAGSNSTPIKVPVSNLGNPPKIIKIDVNNVPDKFCSVTATLTLDSGETESDQAVVNF